MLSFVVVGNKLLYEDGKIQHAGIEMMISKERNPNEYYLPEHIAYKEADKEIPTKTVDCVTGACLLVPKSIFLQFNGFDEQYDKVFQDVDFCLQVARFGYKCMCYNDKSSIHLESATRSPEINQHDYYIMVDRWGSTHYTKM